VSDGKRHCDDNTRDWVMAEKDSGRVRIVLNHDVSKFDEGGRGVMLTREDARAFAADVLAAAGGATMTGRQAATSFIAEWYADKSNSIDTFARDWFAAHWPAATVKPDLTVAPAFDVEAVAREIVGGLVTGFPTPYEVQSVAAILRRHAPAATGGGVQVVEVTGEDVKVYGIGDIDSERTLWWDVYNDADALEAIATGLNARLRARAVPADAPGWVSRPTGEASSLPPMPDEPVVVCVGVGEPRFYESGESVNTNRVTRWCLHAEFNASFDGVTPIPWRVRQPATPGGWTAETVPEGDVMAYMPTRLHDAPDGTVYAFHRIVPREQVADRLNEMGAERIYVVPTPERGA
jgi:hypothetical protein